MSNFWHLFEMPSFCGTEAILAKCASFCGSRQTAKEPAFFAEGLAETSQKLPPKTPVLRGEAFHELRRGPKTSTAARPRSRRLGLPRSSGLASFCCRKQASLEKSLGPRSLKSVQIWAPSQLVRIYIYIYLWPRPRLLPTF